MAIPAFFQVQKHYTHVNLLLSQQNSISFTFPKLTQEIIFRTVFFVILGSFIINIFCLVLMIFITKSSYHFRIWAHENGVEILQLQLFQIVPITCGLIFILKNLINYYAFDGVKRILSQKYTGEELLKNIDKDLKYLYNSFYYTISSILSLFFFRTEYWYPSELGGHGNCNFGFHEYPLMPQVQLKLIFYFSRQKTQFFTIQFNLRVTITHYSNQLFKGRNANFGNTCFTIFWLLLSFFSQQPKILVLFQLVNISSVIIGAILLILHDISDAFLSIARVYTDLFSKKNDKLVLFLYIILLLSWIWTRLYVLPNSMLNEFKIHQDHSGLWDIIKYSFYFMNLEVALLFCMHIFWLYYMVKIGLNLIISKNYKDVYYNNVKQNNKKNS